MSATPTPAIRPKIRAITGFANLNSDTYEGVLSSSLDVLRKAKTEFESAGYDVAEVRLTSQPVAQLIGGGVPEDQALTFLKNLDDLTIKENFILNVGPAMLHDVDDPTIMQVMKHALSTLQHIETSVIIADAPDGIHWKTIRYAADLVQYVSEHSPQSLGNLNFAAMAMLNPYSPFFPGSYHTEEGEQFSIGLECANTVYQVLTEDKGNYISALANLTAALTQQISAAGTVGSKIAKETSWNFLGVYLAPTQGDLSVTAAIEAYTGEKFGSGGTLTALRLVADAVQAVTQSANTGLLSVLEDKLLSQRWAESAFNIDSLLAYSAVGCLGLDTIPLPGNTSVGQLKRIYSDVAALASKWNTPLIARLLPVAGKKAGDLTDFKNPHLFNTSI